jgi:sterol desaturase/sphingolipid hydroxylase (fatty acid hydroxylase superfamily)
MPLKYIQIIILTSVFLLQYALEHLYPQRREINDWKNERFNIGIGLLNLILNFLPAYGLVYLLRVIAEHNLGLLQQFQITMWMQIIITILILDLWMYFWHRLNHVLPFFWRFHRFHHTDEKMNTTTAVRFHIIELFLSVPGKAAIYLIMGFEFSPVIIYELLFFTSVVIHHSNIYISKKVDSLYRLIFASPFMHRIHHSVNKEERNTNYGALFSFWDRLFTSFRINKNTASIQFGVKE